ncbi:AAA domain-containing protein [Sporosarcina highlanderae]|uniref:AAA domain-containing protein n=1 Tax=Sporosarcina highlanderae TaxID=3035916 RepID=A0ABT8JSC2_9BACL|nr:AAA domain-containing protein [Sporosarcina highlanderae]MDN4608035.1 AAA domain-containing protein [Sporosarcina highlanderae]
MEKNEVLKCRLDMTHRARKEIGNWAIDENELFSMQDNFAVYIEKLPAKQDNMTFSFYFDPEANAQLGNHLKERVAVMECVYKNEGFLATSFRVKGRKEPVRTNRRLGVRLKFMVNQRTGSSMPIDLYTSLRELPVAQERSEYVEKRIKSWEGYLRIEEKNADVADITAHFSHAHVNESFSQLTITCSGLDAKDWGAITGFSAKLKGSGDDLGNVVIVNRGKRTVKIELSRKYQAIARRGSLLPKDAREIVFSNFAELSQIRRLRKGFKDLQDGFAANPNLEKILFEERPVVQITNKRMELEFHHPLNEFQQEAVIGAMSANDLYVIQGPPGTGKTTVISELCHQLMKAGQRTLVASQSNLAVDNALGRLLSDPGIRILRYGRTESIEEEGKRFIEENVALHWRDETLAAVNEQREKRADREKQIQLELEENQKEIDRLQAELEIVEQQIANKLAAEAESRELSNQLEPLRQKEKEIIGNRIAVEEQQAELSRLKEKLSSEIKTCEEAFEDAKINLESHEEMANTVRELARQQKMLRYFQTVDAIDYAEMAVRRLKEGSGVNEARREPLTRFLEQLPSVKRLQELEKLFVAHQLEPTLPTKLEINALQRLRVEIIKGTYPYALLEWNEVADRLSNGIEYAEKMLKKYFYPVEEVRSNYNDKYKTPEEMHEMLDKISRFFVLPATKKTLAMPANPQKAALLHRLADNLSYLYGKAEEVKRHAVNIKASSDREAAGRFATLKSEIMDEMMAELSEMKNDEEKASREIIEHEVQLNGLKEEILALTNFVDEHIIRHDIEQTIAELEMVLADFEKRKDLFLRAEQALKEINEKSEKTADQLSNVKETFAGLIDEESELLNEIQEHESRIQDLQEIIQSDPESRKQEISEETEAKQTITAGLHKELGQLPIAGALQDEWSELLVGASDFDLDEIRKLYVKHANVIGTTCVASARRDFMEDYPNFDVVIIDEVSKATPPELLLPMLKGKKIVLVGDHHQLPPLVGRETMDEFIEEIKDVEEKSQLRGMLKESLFERLFRSLPKQNKAMLAIQYRMHEEIMETITPFYVDGNYRLQCGLMDSDAARDHMLSSQYVRRDDHLLWFDMPNEPSYFEAQVKGGTSLFNEAELRRIRELLLDIESGTELAKREGRMKADAKKSVGVISFYGEQVKRIDRLIEQELMPKHLHCRTGSVDKFQGMEMDIIILSFVRNHHQPSGTIGFAEDYRRLNVALSRARELLIIVGSSEMFMNRPKKAETKAMYTRLVEKVKQGGGFKEFELAAERNG